MALGLQRCPGTAGQRCGVIVRDLPRCPAHTREHDRDTLRSKRQRRPKLPGETARRATAVTEHIEEHGQICPGYRRPPHPSVDLTADHLHPYALTRDEAGPLVVLCRSCNSSKGAHCL